MNDDLRTLLQYVSWRNIALGITTFAYVALVIIGVLWVAAQAWNSS